MDTTCKFCGNLCKNANSLRNHQRLCKENPDRQESSFKKYNEIPGRIPWNKGLTKETNESLLSASNRLKEQGFGGWSKEASSRGGKKGGGYRKTAGHGKKFHVSDSSGKIVCLQSTYELECSKILDRLSIKWTRPTSLKYGDKLYFPDFLLVDHGIYIDTKNDYLAKLDKHKIDSVMKENAVTVLILTKDLITEEFLRQFE
jgi:hypothetical protein